jgi:hypothetical protein
MGHTEKYDLLCSFMSAPADIFCRHIAVAGTSSSDDGLTSEIVDSPTVKKGSTQSSPTIKNEKP